MQALCQELIGLAFGLPSWSFHFLEGRLKNKSWTEAAWNRLETVLHFGLKPILSKSGGVLSESDRCKAVFTRKMILAMLFL